MTMPEPSQARPSQVRQGSAGQRKAIHYWSLDQSGPETGQNQVRMTLSCQVSQSRFRVRLGQGQPDPAKASQSQLGQSEPGSARRQPGQSQSWTPPSRPEPVPDMTRVFKTDQGKPRPTKNIQGHGQGCQSQLDKPELGKASHGRDHVEGQDRARLGQTGQQN